MESNEAVPTLNPIGQIEREHKGRIKDFEIVGAFSSQSPTGDLYFVTASSNGAICVWALDRETLLPDTRTSGSASSEEARKPPADGSADNGRNVAPQIGKLLGKTETGHRITCLVACLMSETPPVHAGRPEHTSGKRKADRDSSPVKDSESRAPMAKKSKTAANSQATSSILG